MRSIQRLRTLSMLQPAVVLISAFVASVTLAAEHEHREHDAHAHGHGTLDIVVEAEEALFELRVPAVNVVGFEHAPRDDAEHEAVRRALEPLQDAPSVFALPTEAQCTVETVEARISGVTQEVHRVDGHDGADAHAGHEDEGHEVDAGEGEHSELRATYRFHCGAPERLNRIDARVLEHLHDIEQINVRVVTPTAQLATELHPDSTIVEMAP